MADKYSIRGGSLEAEHFKGDGIIVVGRSEIPVPAGSYVCWLRSGLVILDAADFEALFQAVSGPVVKAYV